MRVIAALLLCASIGSASEAVRPTCNAKNRGRFWPEEANGSGAAARQASRCGELLMCSVGIWKYRWQPLTVPYARLAGTTDTSPSGCRAADSNANPESQQSAAVEE